MKQFDIPTFYRSPIISRVKQARKILDPRKKDFTPTVLDFGPVRFLIARHFGFCYGVENAIEISFKAVEKNPGKRVFLISEMIHNPEVNRDLRERGVDFLQDTLGNPLIPLEDLKNDDIVIIPAFGTTLEFLQKLEGLGVEIKQYDTTCPFVMKVWKRADQLGQKDHTIVVHGKPKHEETRATFSHAAKSAPTVVVKNMEETHTLAKIIKGEIPLEEFPNLFKGRYSEGFNPEEDLNRIGVVNQTTMLATETQAIADYLKQSMVEKYGEAELKSHFADTRDTLCYATNDNQSATYGLLDHGADLAVVVGGYNSSNTTHLVELCEEKMPTYFITTAAKIMSEELINHFDIHEKQEVTTQGFLPEKRPLDIILTSGASCPDALVDEVLRKLLGYFEGTRDIESILEELEATTS